MEIWHSRQHGYTFVSVKSVTGHVDDAAVYSLGLTVVTRTHTCHREREISMNGILCAR